MATHGVALLFACIFNVNVVCRDHVMFLRLFEFFELSLTFFPSASFKGVIPL